MSRPSIEILDINSAKTEILGLALGAGFSRARVLAPFQPPESDGERGRGGGYGEAAPAALVAALPYGTNNKNLAVSDVLGVPTARLDGFSRRNYYAETVARLQKIAVELRPRFGGSRSDYRILCNSPIPEKPLAAACGLGTIGRNSLVITPEAGSLVVIGVLTLPFALKSDGPLDGFDPCLNCANCAAACPTARVGRNGRRGTGAGPIALHPVGSRRARGEIPPEIAAKWGDRLYGCSICRDVCPANQGIIRGAETERGALPEAFDAEELAEASDETLKALFKGTALGMSWLGPEAIRRNARLAAAARKLSKP